MYAKETLGIDGFTQQSKQVQHQLENISEKFREKMNAYIGADSKNMIFTEDLKNMVYLAQNDDDIDLVIKMTKK